MITDAKEKKVMIINYKGRQLDFDEEFLKIYKEFTFKNLEEDINYALKNMEIDNLSEKEIVNALKKEVIGQIELLDCPIQEFIKKREI
ncbi:MAG: hypothetical protein E7242_01070 [Lachnospiraceae bacterium]|nr:hypothetical protein [Lachnospiraceae bacterium]